MRDYLFPLSTFFVLVIFRGSNIVIPDYCVTRGGEIGGGEGENS